MTTSAKKVNKGFRLVYNSTDPPTEAAPPAKKSNDFSINNEEAGEDWKPKKMCPFGANCYRRNPDHLAEFRHPGKQK